MTSFLKASEVNDAEQSIQELFEKLPVACHGQVQDACHAMNEGDAGLARSILDRLLESGVDFDRDLLLPLRGQCSFMLGEYSDALDDFEGLAQRHPDEVDMQLALGQTFHAMGRYEDAVEQFEPFVPMNEYQPFIYTAYGDALVKCGRGKEAAGIFRLDVKQYLKTGEIPSPQMLDGAFQNVLMLDILYEPDSFDSDLAAWKKFLADIELTSEMRDYIRDTVYWISTQLPKKWLREPFVQLLDYLTGNDILPGNNRTIETGYVAEESYRLHEDSGISPFTEEYQKRVNEWVYASDDMDPAEKDEIEDEFEMYNWYMCRYCPGHKEEFLHLQEMYPHIYRMLAPYLERAQTEPELYSEEILDKIWKHASPAFPSREKLQVFLEHAYKKEARQRRVPVPVYSGEQPYERTSRKVMPNDPCPCGSGKKFKKCCKGKGIYD